MAATNLESGLSLVPNDLYCYFKSFLKDESHYRVLADYLKYTSIVLIKDGFQIPLSSVQDLEETMILLDKRKSKISC